MQLIGYAVGFYMTLFRISSTTKGNICHFYVLSWVQILGGVNGVDVTGAFVNGHAEILAHCHDLKELILSNRHRLNGGGSGNGMPLPGRSDTKRIQPQPLLSQVTYEMKKLL